MRSLTSRCIDSFPELAEQFSLAELQEASEIGAYILHEDFLNALILKRRADQEFCQRYAEYINHLTASAEPDARDLAEVALIENIVNERLRECLPFLSPASLVVLERVLQRMRPDDAQTWMDR